MLKLARAIRLALLALALVVQAHAQAGDEAAIRIWGHGHRGQDYILTLLQAWQHAFQKAHPDARFDNQLTGDASGLGGLYTHVADLALLDREASFIEVDSYQQGLGYDPFRIPVAKGAVDTPHHAPALKLFVNPANPLQQLTLTQLDALFDADHRRGGPPIRTWGDLGLPAPWASQPIHIDTYEIQSAEIQFLERAALKGSQKFACCLTLFPKHPATDPDQKTLDTQIAAAVAKDKYSLALIASSAPSLKPVPLAATDAGPAVLPTPETITANAYPLARTIYLYANRKPESPVPPNVAAFLDFVLSPQGQAIAARTGGYLPLSPQEAAQAREALQ
jgi:phosphate transport system substrate-binding protein